MQRLILIAAIALAACQTTNPTGSVRNADDDEVLGLTRTYEWPVQATSMPRGTDLGAMLKPFLEFCLKQVGPDGRDLAYCQTDPAVETLTADKWKALEAAQRIVNEMIVFVPEEEGKDEFKVLTHPGQEGDCEDLALTKRDILIRIGFDPGALRLAQCRLRTSRDKYGVGEGHAVLTVETDRGTWVMGAYGPVVPWDASECDTYGMRWAGITWEDLRI